MNEPTRRETEQAIVRISAALESKRLTINALDDGSGVVLDVDGEQMLTANATGIAIVQAIAEGHRDPDAITRAVAVRFDVDVERARSDAEGFVVKVAAGL